MPSVGSLLVTLKAETDSLRADLEKAKGRIRDFERETRTTGRKAGESFGAMGLGAEKLGASLGRITAGALLMSGALGKAGGIGEGVAQTFGAFLTCGPIATGFVGVTALVKYFGERTAESGAQAKLEMMPRRTAPSGIRPLFAEVIREVPVPGLGPGPGSLPRFRSELGPFIGLAMWGDARYADGGFGKTQTTGGAIGGLGAAVRLGLGLEGVLSEAGDGLIFLDLGVRLDSSSSMRIDKSEAAAVGGGITAAIPSRWAFVGRLRLPFWLIPGDLLLALPTVAPI